MNRLDGAPTLPIKDETDIALEALARQMYADYDVSEEEAMQMARAELMKTMDATGYPTPEASGNDAAARLAEQHMAAGASPERAQRLGEGYTRIHGPQEAWARVQRNNTPDGKAFLENANREMDADDARHQKMYDDYFTATNAPSHQKVSPETQRQWDDTERYAREQGRIIRAGLHPQTPVDPIDPEATYSSDEEAAQKKADRDAQMEGVFKNIRQRYGESEEANARAAYAAGDTYVPQTAQQASRNENYRNDQYAAMKDDGEARDRLRGVDDRRQPYVRARQLRELGLPDDAPGSEISDSRIRQLLAEKRASEKASQDMLWKQRAMIQGGNAIGAMLLPGQDDWGRSAIAGGPTPLSVQAAAAAGSGRAMDADVRLAALQAQMQEAEAARQLQAQQFQERMQADASQRETERQLALRQNDLAAERLKSENARGLAEINARLQASQMDMDARLGSTNAAIKEKEMERTAAEAAALRGRQLAWQQQEPGLFDIASGRGNTRAASAALKAIAAASDRYQWLPGGGFGIREATAMNEELLRIASQAEQFGMKTQLSDPQYRKKLIQQYGYSSGWSGGRGGWIGDLWQPMPEGLE